QFAPEFASPIAAQSILMSYSELQFILAEAREKGYITSGSAETYYLNGIRDQFEYYSSRIPDSFELPTAAQVIPPNSYYTQPNVAYTGSSEDKLNKIYIQKWLSLFLNGGEAWSHWRRTGVPEIVAGPNNEGFVPVRYVYPADEQRLNEENYNDALGLLGGPDNLTTKVWWDVD
ncbi:MAG TPA: SusD/RagB family nutrient-binding outer membrane lipoprotein, partial [Arenibacter sp.]|nr:SusD/RagB family nutrient-binding outer membrane lipoprotein [Arenibacter sp.]